MLVCRDWNELLIPLLWRTINDKLYSWLRILKDLTDSSSTPEEQVQKEDWIRGIYVKYGHQIRNLDANSVITILSAQATGSCIHFRTLTVVGFVLVHPSQEAQLLREQFRYDVTSTEAQAGMSKVLISPVFEGVFSTAPPSLSNEANELRWWQQWVFTQRFWLLVLQNPDLVGLRLGKKTSHLHLGLQDGFILRTLASLRNLTKLDTYICNGDFGFRAVLEQLPQVQHFASGYGKLSMPIFDRRFLQIRTMHCTVTDTRVIRTFFRFSTVSQISTSYGYRVFANPRELKEGQLTREHPPVDCAGYISPPYTYRTKRWTPYWRTMCYPVYRT